ncbi:MAG: hypothetical protein U0796_18190 [Gemmatales bacterium]
MNERDFRQALQNEASYVPPQLLDPGVLTRRIIRRDGTRVWLIGYFCLVAWLGVSIGGWFIGLEYYSRSSEIATHLILFHNKDEPAASQIAPAQPPRKQEENGQLPKQASETFVRSLRKLNEVLEGSKWYFFWLLGGEALLLFLAAVLSVAYVSSGRKATLRQLNATLLKISEQLKDDQSVSGASTS